MCGIVGYTGTRHAEPVLIEGLQKLEYRGYDSAGICTVDGNGVRTVRRALGKLSALKARLASDPCPGNTNACDISPSLGVHGFTSIRPQGKINRPEPRGACPIWLRRLVFIPKCAVGFSGLHSTPIDRPCPFFL